MIPPAAEEVEVEIADTSTLEEAISAGEAIQ
jgi:hypothetical protein